MILIYTTCLQLIRLLRPLLRLLPHEKLKFFFRESGRIHLTTPLTQRPIWIHASSGEIEYAKSVIRNLKSEFPGIPLLVTHTSVSSQKAVASIGAEAYGVSPLDTPQEIQAFLQKWQPRLCLIARTDLWYQTLTELKNANIPAFLFSATFAEGSRKTSWAARALMRKCIPLLTEIFFVSEDDLALCKNLFPQFRGQILGDTRYDQVLYRLSTSQKPGLPMTSPTQPIFLAGSTWTEDEEVLIPAFAKLKEKGWKFVVVPHEVSEISLRSLETLATEKGLLTARYSRGNLEWMQTDVLIIDEVGLLASLYPYARVAFVGGSFRKQVHSVMEALAAPRPVIVGPFYHNNREAIDFKQKGFVFSANRSDEIVEAALRYEKDFSSVCQKIQNEIQLRTGATHRLMTHLKSAGFLPKNESTEFQTS